ncbi:hypothetical protein [Bordetella pertussis]|uniref:hypothetical protein n=1 Tax=Bordetella pertussis TaxID=520 RepID=UPI001075B6F6|nr:hypothetical protein [Bordetella pertussis]
MNWGGGDFQFLKSGSDEPCIQPIESSQVVDLVPDERHRPHLRWFVNYLIIRMIVRFINEEAAACQAQIFITNRLFGFYNNFQESNQGKPLGRFLKTTLKENISN